MVEASRAEVIGEAGFDLPAELPTALRRLLEYWQQRCPAGGTPPRDAFDPLDLKGLWHDTSVLQLGSGADGEVEISIRYAGAHLDGMHGISLAGKRLLDVIDETEARRTVPSLTRAAVEGVPHYRSGHRPHHAWGTVAFERLMVPFRGTDDAVRYLVGVWHWPKPAPRRVLRMGDGVHMISSRPPVLD